MSPSRGTGAQRQGVNMKSKIVTCPECKGKREKRYIIDNLSLEEDTLPCKTCKGVGMMYREVTIAYKPVPENTLERIGQVKITMTYLNKPIS